MNPEETSNRTLPFELIPLVGLPVRWQEIVDEMPHPELVNMAVLGLTSVIHGLGGEGTIETFHALSAPLQNDLYDARYSMPNTFLPGHVNEPDSPRTVWFEAGTSLLIALQGAAAMLRHAKVRYLPKEEEFKWRLPVPEKFKRFCMYRATGERGAGIDLFSLSIAFRTGFIHEIALRASYADSTKTKTVGCVVQPTGVDTWVIAAKNGSGKTEEDPAPPVSFTDVRRMGQALQLAAYTVEKS